MPFDPAMLAHLGPLLGLNNAAATPQVNPIVRPGVAGATLAGMFGGARPSPLGMTSGMAGQIGAAFGTRPVAAGTRPPALTNVRSPASPMPKYGVIRKGLL